MEIILVGITLLTMKVAEAYCEKYNPPTKKCIVIGLGSLISVSLVISAPIAYYVRINSPEPITEQNLYITLAVLVVVCFGSAYRCVIHASD
jgi:hypothetical protein